MFASSVSKSEYENGSLSCVSPEPRDVGNYVVKRMVRRYPTEQNYAAQVFAQVIEVEYIGEGDDNESAREVSIVELSPDGEEIISEEQKLVLDGSGMITRPGEGYLIGNWESPEDGGFLAADELLVPLLVRRVPREDVARRQMEVNPYEQ